MNIFNKIRLWLHKKIFFIGSEESIKTVKTEKIDERTKEVRKRVKKSFEAQQEQMNARAMKSHGPLCIDVINCKKRICFKWEPDKIVSDPYLINSRKD